MYLHRLLLRFLGDSPFSLPSLRVGLRQGTGKNDRVNSRPSPRDPFDHRRTYGLSGQTPLGPAYADRSLPEASHRPALAPNRPGPPVAQPPAWTGFTQ